MGSVRDGNGPERRDVAGGGAGPRHRCLLRSCQPGESSNSRLIPKSDLATRVNDDQAVMAASIGCAFNRPTEGCSCEGFRIPAITDAARCTGAGVRKPPGKEPAG